MDEAERVQNIRIVAPSGLRFGEVLEGRLVIAESVIVVIPECKVAVSAGGVEAERPFTSFLREPQIELGTVVSSPADARPGHGNRGPCRGERRIELASLVIQLQGRPHVGFQLAAPGEVVAAKKVLVGLHVARGLGQEATGVIGRKSHPDGLDHA